MVQPPPGSQPASEMLAAAERATRQLADACFAAWDAMVSRGGAIATRNAHAVMDASYVASTTSRLIAHQDQYQLHMIAMQIAVCRRVASRCATICEEGVDDSVRACARVARAAVAACTDVLRILWNGALAAAAHEDEESGETSVA